MNSDPHPRCRHCGGQLPRVGVCGSPACAEIRKKKSEYKRAQKAKKEQS